MLRAPRVTIVIRWGTDICSFSPRDQGLERALLCQDRRVDGADQILGGGVANAGAVVRSGSPVLDDDVSSERLGWRPSDRPRRLRLICDTYGLDPEARLDLFESLSASIAQGGEFVRRRADLGHPGFVKLWAEIGGMERFDRRRRWWAEAQTRFEEELR